jgi:predicted AAA+ superfamily ATPase
MSESNLPPFGPARLRIFLKTFRPVIHLKEALGRLRTRGRRDAVPVQEAALEPRAARALREHLDAHAANLERAVRLGEKAERLEKAGIPNESARNQAERARGEVVAGLAALRASFIEAAGGRKAARAFDRVLEVLYPAFAPLRRLDRRYL